MVTLERKSGATVRLPHPVAEVAAVVVVPVAAEVQFLQAQRLHRQLQHKRRPPRRHRRHRLFQRERVVALAEPHPHLGALLIGLGMPHIPRAFW
jgi:hypothetical protein